MTRMFRGVVVAALATALAAWVAGAASAGPRTIAASGTAQLRSVGPGPDGLSQPEIRQLEEEGEGDEQPGGEQGHFPFPKKPLPTPKVHSADLAGANPELGLSVTGLTSRDQRLANGGNQFSVEPPDQALCVGNGKVLESVNTVIRVRDTARRRLDGRRRPEHLLRLPGADQPDDAAGLRAVPHRSGLSLRAGDQPLRARSARRSTRIRRRATSWGRTTSTWRSAIPAIPPGPGRSTRSLHRTTAHRARPTTVARSPTRTTCRSGDEPARRDRRLPAPRAWTRTASTWRRTSTASSRTVQRRADLCDRVRSAEGCEPAAGDQPHARREHEDRGHAGLHRLAGNVIPGRGLDRGRRH